MAVTVRLFAALREAAGTATTQVEAGSLDEVVAALAERYGEPFASRLAVASVLVEGETVRHGARIDVPDGVEVALLPPVSGG